MVPREPETGTPLAVDGWLGRALGVAVADGLAVAEGEAVAELVAPPIGYGF